MEAYNYNSLPYITEAAYKEYEAILNADLISLITDSRYKQIEQLALLNFSEISISNLVQPGIEAKNNFVTEVLALAKKTCRIASIVFFILGLSVTSITLLAGLNHPSPSVVLLSALSGITLGSGFGMLGIFFRLQTIFWEFAEQKWISSYFSSNLQHNQAVDQLQIRNWVQVKAEDLKGIEEKIKQTKLTLEKVQHTIGLRLDTAIQLETIILFTNQKIKIFRETRAEFKRRTGGQELLTFLSY